MERKVFILLGVGSFLFSLYGCGTDPLTPSANVKLSIYWPQRSTTSLTKATTGLSSALSAKVKLTGAAADGSDFVFSVDRPAGTAAILQDYTSADQAKTGNHPLWIGFFAEPAGQGEVVGEANNTINLECDGTGIGEVTTVGTVTDVYVPPQSVNVGETKRLVCSVNDKNGRLMALLPGAVFWSVVENQEHLKFESAQAVGIKHGSALAQATVDGITSEAASIKVAVIPAAQMIPLLPGAPANAYSDANDVSANGLIVVGACTGSDGNIQAFQWTKGGSIVGLGVLAGFDESFATGVSASGKIVVGYCQSKAVTRKTLGLPSIGRTPFIWTAETGMQKLDTYFDDYDNAVANGISADGTRVVGSYNEDPDVQLGFLWEKDKGVTPFSDLLPVGVPQHKTDLAAISSDGKWLVGGIGYNLSSDPDPRVLAEGVIFHEVGNGIWDITVTGFTPNGDNPESFATCVDGHAWVVGGSTGTVGSPNFSNPFQWTNITGMVMNIPQYNGTYLAVADDAWRMGGGGADPGTAFLWDPENGYQGLLNLLNVLGLMDDLQASPVNVSAMSHDGQIIVGSGYYTVDESNSFFRAIYMEIP
jgi:probable HAF family extracellular repeat protein